MESDCTHFSDRELTAEAQHCLGKAQRGSGTPLALARQVGGQMN